MHIREEGNHAGLHIGEDGNNNGVAERKRTYAKYLNCCSYVGKLWRTEFNLKCVCGIASWLNVL
jgi:hypothetical protein